jgi:hypothetical protein
MSIAPIHDRHKKCFAYCGDDRCNCPARNAFGLLGRASTALPVLSATEMHAEIEAASKSATPNTPDMEAKNA